MKVTDEMIDKLADLAKLEFSNEERAQMKNDFKKMLDFVDKLEELDTDGVEPLVYMTEETNVLRADKVEQEITQAEAHKNATQADSDYIKVPRVLTAKD